MTAILKAKNTEAAITDQGQLAAALKALQVKQVQQQAASSVVAAVGIGRGGQVILGVAMFFLATVSISLAVAADYITSDFSGGPDSRNKITGGMNALLVAIGLMTILCIMSLITCVWLVSTS